MGGDIQYSRLRLEFSDCCRARSFTAEAPRSQSRSGCRRVLASCSGEELRRGCIRALARSLRSDTAKCARHRVRCSATTTDQRVTRLAAVVATASPEPLASAESRSTIRLQCPRLCSRKSGTRIPSANCRTARRSCSSACIWSTKSRARRPSTCCARAAGRCGFPAGRSRRSITSCRRAISGGRSWTSWPRTCSRRSSATAARPACRCSTCTAARRASST